MAIRKLRYEFTQFSYIEGLGKKRNEKPITKRIEEIIKLNDGFNSFIIRKKLIDYINKKALTN